MEIERSDSMPKGIRRKRCALKFDCPKIKEYRDYICCMDCKYKSDCLLACKNQPVCQRNVNWQNRKKGNNIEHILNLSYGKDSIACIEAIKRLGLPLDRIIHAEIWATDTISADLPPMVEFKKKADKIIKQRYGIEVEHITAMKNEEKLTYEKWFYTINHKRKQIYGFPFRVGAWCNSRLKRYSLNYAIKKVKNTVQYIGIANDEIKRIKRWTRNNFVLPLVEIGWSEADCKKWCAENDLLSPIYETLTRGGCWFCHNQTIQELRLLRKYYPKLWELLLKWDADSLTTFHADGRSVHDFDRRFELEEKNLIPIKKIFRWDMLHDETVTKQMTLEDVFVERRKENE